MIGKWRRVFQFAVIVFMFVIPVLNIYEIYLITGTFYALNIGGLGIADPAVILQAVFAAGTLTLPLLTAAIFPILIILVLGRIWCGWLCPYGAISDFIAFVRGRLHFKARRFDDVLQSSSPLKANLTRVAILLVGTAAAGAIGIPLLNFISAPGVLSTEAMMFVKERSVSIEVFFLVVLVITEVAFLPHFWCKYFCPTGTCTSLLTNRRSLHVEQAGKVANAPCCKEMDCTKVCPMGLQPYKESRNSLCTNCGRCIDACKNSRLQYKGFGFE